MVTRPSSKPSRKRAPPSPRIDCGEDPLEERKQEAASENTFKDICEEFFRRDDAALRTGDRRKR
jgi:hypothetical protein